MLSGSEASVTPGHGSLTSLGMTEGKVQRCYHRE
jgi:hypothetical protein